MFYPFNYSQCLLALLSGHVTSHKNCYFVNDFIISHLSFITYHDTSSRYILIKPDSISASVQVLSAVSLQTFIV